MNEALQRALAIAHGIANAQAAGAHMCRCAGDCRFTEVLTVCDAEDAPAAVQVQVVEVASKQLRDRGQEVQALPFGSRESAFERSQTEAWRSELRVAAAYQSVAADVDARVCPCAGDCHCPEAWRSELSLVAVPADMDARVCPCAGDCHCLEARNSVVVTVCNAGDLTAAAQVQVPEVASKQPGDESHGIGRSVPGFERSQPEALRSELRVAAAYQSVAADVDTRVCPCARDCHCLEELDSANTKKSYVVAAAAATVADNVVVKAVARQRRDACRRPCRLKSTLSKALRSWRRKRIRLEEQSCKERERCHMLWQREQEALKEKRVIANACESMLLDLEAASKKCLVKGEAPLAGKPEDASKESSDLAWYMGDFQQRSTHLLETLSKFLQRVEEAKEVLSRVLSCTLSLEVFQFPVLAPDGQVYEYRNIMTWLKENPTSPLTRMPMRPNELVHDRVVQQATEALWLLLGEEPPEEKAEVGEARLELPKALVLGLHEAILSRDEATSLEMLAQSGQIAGLNARYGEEQATLLHLALLHGLPAVAEAIIMHPFFHKHSAPMGAPRKTVRAIHIAASLGMLSVCQALVQRCSGSIAVWAITRKTSLALIPSGRLLEFEVDHSALEMADLGGHRQIVELLLSALDAVGNQTD